MATTTPSGWPRRRALRIVLAAAVLGAVAGGVASAASDATPPDFGLVFESGGSTLAVETLFRSGSFTASAPACRSGRGADVRYVYPDRMLREYRCDDGSGSFTALVAPSIAEQGGVGEWRILGGTRRYAELRGIGVFEGEFVSGSPSEAATVMLRSTWSGKVGFDAVAPSIRGLRIAAESVRGSAGAYRLRISFTVRDDISANDVAYLVLPWSEGARLPYREARTAPGRVTLTLRIRPPAGARRVVVEIRAADPLGNERRVVGSAELSAARR